VQQQNTFDQRKTQSPEKIRDQQHEQRPGALRMIGIKGHSCEKIRSCETSATTVPPPDNPAKPIAQRIPLKRSYMS
jgi:hypothetical protein